MKVLVNGKVRWRLPCVVCGKPRDAKAKSGRCRRCWTGKPKHVPVRMRGGKIAYRLLCPKCEAPMDPASALCRSCEQRRRWKAGVFSKQKQEVGG